MTTKTWGLVIAALAAVGCSCSAGPRASGMIDNGGADAGAGWIGNGTGGGSGGGGAQACVTASDCPKGYTCEANLCVPPETETNHSLSDAPPVATPHYVFALNPTAASVARIDPISLAIEAVPVGPKPVGIAALPGEDAAVVLSYDDASLSILDATAGPTRVTRVALPRQYGMLSVSADGAFAVAWPDPSAAPASGAEGIFALIDLAAARQGHPASQVVEERGAGYRITDVFFRLDAGRATRLHVFAKSSVSTFNLVLPASPLPTRLTLPASMSADVASREITATADAHLVMLRSTVAAELASFDGTALATVALPEVATDLDLLPDGTAAVVALRTAKSLAWIRIPQDLLAPAGIALFPLDGGAVGQVALPPLAPDAGFFALVYSNVADDEGFSRVELPSGVVSRYPLEKWVSEISVSPDARSAVILHRANPATTATDPYEAAVDKDQGYSVFDLATGAWQLQRTGTVRPTRYAFSPVGGYVGVALRDDANRKYALHAVNLSTLVPTVLPLMSTPLYMGTVPQAPGITPHRVFVSQDHPAGRVSVIQLDTGQVRTATGFTLNGEIR